MRRAQRQILPARAGAGRILGGVCAGIARTVGVDVTLVRLAFLVLILAWGLGVVLYLSLWAFMPDAEGEMADSWRDHFRRRMRDARSDVSDWGDRLAAGWQEVGKDPWPRPIGRRWMALFLIGIGALVLLASLGAFSWITPLRAASLAMVVVGAGALLSMRG